jgi:hypothetical protein
VQKKENKKVCGKIEFGIKQELLLWLMQHQLQKYQLLPEDSGK